MDPFTIGILVTVCASSAVAAMRLRRGGSPPGLNAGGSAKAAGSRSPGSRALPSGGAGGDAQGVRVGDVLTHLADEFWLAGEVSVVREGAAVIRLFSAPERGRERWVALPRDGKSLWVLFTEPDVARMGWPGVELPAGGRTLRRVEYGNAALAVGGEGVASWEGMGRFALFRAHDAVAVVVEKTGGDRMALVGREIPRQLVQKMG